MKTLIITQPAKFACHKEIAKALVNICGNNGIEASIYDYSVSKPPHIKYGEIKTIQPDFLITLDCAGFDMLNENDELSYNTFPFRIAHLLTRGAGYYRQELLYQMNFSTFVYLPEKSSVGDCIKNRPNIANWGTWNPEDLSSLNHWLTHFLEEAMLKNEPK